MATTYFVKKVNFWEHRGFPPKRMMGKPCVRNVFALEKSMNFFETVIDPPHDNQISGLLNVSSSFGLLQSLLLWCLPLLKTICTVKSFPLLIKNGIHLIIKKRNRRFKKQNNYFCEFLLNAMRIRTHDPWFTRPVLNHKATGPTTDKTTNATGQQ